MTDTNEMPIRTVVVVDDDAPLRELIMRVLERSGWRCIGARNGEGALHKARAHEGGIDLLIADVVLPHLNGFDLAAEIVATHPETRVLYISGRADDSVAVRGGLREAERPFLLKPFTRDELIAAIDAIFDAS